LARKPSFFRTLLGAAVGLEFQRRRWSEREQKQKFLPDSGSDAEKMKL